MRNLRKEIIRSLWMTIKLVLVMSAFIFIGGLIAGASYYSILSSIFISSIYCFAMSWGNGIISSLLEHKFDWIKHTSKRMIWGSILSIVYIIIATLLIDLFVINYYNSGGYELLLTASHLWKNLIIILVASVITIFFYAKYFMKYWKISVIKYQEMEKENIASQYEALKSQTDPHFFFNSLNVLSSLIEEDKDLSQKFIKELANIYRYILEQKDNELSLISEEIKFINKYVFLQKIRFENGISLNIDLDEKVLKQSTISLALQILFENIFKHNAISEEMPISITIKAENDFLIVENTINPMRKGVFSNKIGLNSLKARYSFFTDEEVIIEQDDKTFRAKIPLLTNK
jgi:sensor histidine kinase YesM